MLPLTQLWHVTDVKRTGQCTGSCRDAEVAVMWQLDVLCPDTQLKVVSGVRETIVNRQLYSTSTSNVISICTDEMMDDNADAKRILSTLPPSLRNTASDGLTLAAGTTTHPV